ncbi:primosomal protein N' [Tepidibacter formicigenes]|jgi:primosomal protein N' (replication factor Y)|uniref:Replication restart protein PriA n=1 Tax=Tepidibacter formicigenes DSM 15518 TaxID=1123349 RepID=A0A1M6KGK2_9FIRM|nr:primosomal protein N' [Tepidibacter formicigenes]SHJ58083.1 replication restart DNA helicase PriA [Tepidibacter formicigenes DSM 15518]
MEKYAKVVVSNNSNHTDELYTYKIPEFLIDEIKIGHRVLVTFGRGNKPIEAFVFEISSFKEGDFKVKEIINILDENPILKKRDIEIIKWMREEYICTFMDAINCIYPKGMRVDNYKVVKLIKKEFDNLNKKEIKVLDEIMKNKGKIKVEILKTKLDNSVENIIKKLKDKGIVNISWEYKSIKNEKYIYNINLNILDDEADETVDNLIKKRAFKQADIINFLKNNQNVEINDLMDLLNISKSSIKSLEEKGLITIEKLDYYRKPKTNYEVKNKKINLNEEQLKVISKLKKSMDKENKNPFLLYGVTGSGKTEIYLNIIEEALKKNLDSIVLVPEISLTPQTIARFKNKFKDIIAVLHSKLSNGEKYDEYRRIKEGNAKIVIGARSALFAPCNNLGVIIIDEFHESSYKSEMNPKYNSIEVAKQISKTENCILILGSATPPIEAYYKCKVGEYELLELKNRANNKEMPSIEVVDMKEELNNGNKSIFSKSLFEAIKENLQNNNQTILFLNRRGYASFVSCRKCGYIFKCSNCEISLTYHKRKNVGKCHYCGYEMNIPKECPDCESNYIKEFGIGTQKIEEEVKKYFKDAKVLRMDKDTTSKKGAHEEILNKFKNKEADILIGTQMIGKGLDFENVTLVGILAADMILNFPDFRSSERTFQIINQVAGRAGRAHLNGRVILQSYDTEHYSIEYAVNYDYEGFYKDEIKIRNAFNYIPFNNLISIVIYGKNEKKVINNIQKLYDSIIYILRKRGYENFDFILGPNPCPISKINLNYRWQILLKDINVEIKLLKSIIKYICIQKRELIFDQDVNISIDINPFNIL